MSSEHLCKQLVLLIELTLMKTMIEQKPCVFLIFMVIQAKTLCFSDISDISDPGEDYDEQKPCVFSDISDNSDPGEDYD